MKEWLIRLALIASGVIIPIGAVEFALSTFGPPILTYPPDFTEPDKDLGWKGTPNAETIYRVGKTETLRPLKRNSHGFRDKERTYEKKEGTFRILVLGDSFTEAMQVPLEATVPYILEQKMNSESGKRFEVLNLGIGGYGTGQEYLMLKYHGLKYQPDCVILALFIGNDIVDNSLPLTDLRYPKPHFVLNNGKLEELPFTIDDGTEGILFRSVKGHFRKLVPYTYHLLTSRISSTSTPRLMNVLRTIGLIGSELVAPDQSTKRQTSVQGISTDWYHVYAKQYTPQWEDAWEVTKALFLALKNEVEGKKIGFLVVIIPMELEFRPDRWDKTPYKNPQRRALQFDGRKPERILANFLGANHIEYLLLRPEFENYTKETGKDVYLQDAGEIHWNDNGHRLVAELIYKKLKDVKLIDHTVGHTRPG